MVITPRTWSLKPTKNSKLSIRPYATIDELRQNNYSANIDPEKFYAVWEVIKKDLLCWLVQRSMMYMIMSDVTKGRFIKAYLFDRETKHALKISRPSKKTLANEQQVYIKWEDLLKYLYNNLTPYILYVLEQRNRTRDLFLIKTWACNI